jgi:hypothetical protein
MALGLNFCLWLNSAPVAAPVIRQLGQKMGRLCGKALRLIEMLKPKCSFIFPGLFIVFLCNLAPMSGYTF